MEEIMTIDEMSERYKIHKCTVNTYLARPEFNKFRLSGRKQRFTITDEFLDLFENILETRLMRANRRGRK